MKKFLTITAMLLIVSLAFFSCDNREFEGSPASLPEFDVDTPAAIGTMLSAVNYYNASATTFAGVTITPATATVLFDMTTGTDNGGVKVTLPGNALMYASVTIEIKLVSVDTLQGTGTAKLGFRKGADPLLPYDDHEIVFGTTAGVTKSITIKTGNLSGNFFTFNHNQYGPNPDPDNLTGSQPPIKYTLQITNIKLNA